MNGGMLNLTIELRLSGFVDVWVQQSIEIVSLRSSVSFCLFASKALP